MKIYNLKDKEYFQVKIVKATKDQIPLKKNGWEFNWKLALKKGQVYLLKTKFDSLVQGAIQIIVDDGMLTMEIIELAPWNIGSKKKYDFVAGILIAFCCKEAFKLKSRYTGFLTFTSKTSLVEHYKLKFGAIQTIGQRMYIDPEQGRRLMKKYLK